MTRTETTDRNYASARILAPSGQRMGVPSDTQLALINARAAIALTAEQVFVFDAAVSTDAVDTYFTRMDRETTLPNFVQDFSGGRALLDSHNIWQLPIGSSFAAELEPIADAEGSDATVQVRVSWYLLRDHVVSGNATNDYIRGIEGGTTRRMSVGFGGPDERWICEIDGLELWESQYWPGQRLSDGRRATFRVVNARGYEGSTVYANSCPGALVQRMQELVTDRAIPAAEITRLETAWQVRFDRPAGQQFIGGRTMPFTGRSLMAGITQRAGKTISAATRAKLETASTSLADTAESVDAAMTAIADLLATSDADAEEGRALKAQLGERTMPQVLAEAEAGRAYRGTLEERARTARIAVEGETFTGNADDVKAYNELLAQFPVRMLEAEARRWEGTRAAVFTPGRKVPLSDPNARTDAQRGYTLVDAE